MHPPPGRREQQTADDYEGDDSHRHTRSHRETHFPLVYLVCLCKCVCVCGSGVCLCLLSSKKVHSAEQISTATFVLVFRLSFPSFPPFLLLHCIVSLSLSLIVCVRVCVWGPGKPYIINPTMMPISKIFALVGTFFHPYEKNSF